MNIQFNHPMSWVNLLVNVVFVFGITIDQANSQPTITKTIIPDYGTTIHFDHLRGVGGNPYVDGANVTWDFSGIQDIGGESIFYGDPSGDTSLKYFSGANIFFDAGLIREYNQYYIKTDTSLSYIGGFFNSGRFEHNPHYVSYFFPMNYTDKKSYSNVAKTIFWSGYTITHHNSYSIEIDAYGTLILDKDTIDNLLRAKYTSISNDSSDGVYISSEETIQYVWMHPDQPMNVFSWIKRTRHSAMMGTTIDSSANRITEIKVGITNSNHEHTIHLYPNPTSKTLFIETGNTFNQLDATIMNNLGQVVFKGSYSNNDQLNVNTELLENGSYILLMECENWTATKRFVKTSN